MKIAILIGFEYDFRCKYSKLVGTIKDLSKCYSICKYNYDKIYLLSDIQGDIIVSAVGILDEIKEIRVKKDMSEALENIKNEKINKIFFYYTGHSENTGILLPDNNIFSYDALKKYILSIGNIYTEIFICMDCCNSCNFNLPYTLTDSRFRLSKKTKKFYMNPIMLILSCGENENSASGENGSCFSEIFFKLIKNIDIDKNISLSNLEANIQYFLITSKSGFTQNIQIHASYIFPPVLWQWICTNYDYQIMLDLSHKLLVIKK